MKRFALVALALVAVAWAQSAEAGRPNRWTDSRYAPTWHGAYYDATWGAPVAVVVPPTAHAQLHYNAGVGGTRVSRIWPHYQLNASGDGVGSGFAPTPAWPSSTDQLGDYNVRGPW